MGNPLQQNLVEPVRSIEEPFYMLFGPPVAVFYFIPVRFVQKKAFMDDERNFFFIGCSAKQQVAVKEIRINGPRIHCTGRIGHGIGIPGYAGNFFLDIGEQEYIHPSEQDGQGTCCQYSPK